MFQMAQFKCDICGGRIKMQPDKTGVCEDCGMSYDLETLREMAKTNSSATKAEPTQTVTPQQTAPPQPITPQQVHDPGINSTENAMIKPSEDPLERDVLVTYLDDVRTMETIIQESNACLPKVANARKKRETIHNNWLSQQKFVSAEPPVKEKVGFPKKPEAPIKSQADKKRYIKEASTTFGSLLRILAVIIFILDIIFTASKHQEGATVFDSLFLNIVMAGLLISGTVLSFFGIDFKRALFGMFCEPDLTMLKIEAVGYLGVIVLLLAFILSNLIFLLLGTAVIAIEAIVILIYSRPAEFFKEGWLFSQRVRTAEKHYENQMQFYRNDQENYNIIYPQRLKEERESNEKYDIAMREYNENEVKRKADFDNMLAEELEKFNADIKQLDDFANGVKSDITATKEMLASEYDVNIIPTQFRNIRGVYYLYDYLSTSKQSLSEALMQFNLEAIKQKLDRMIQQNSTIMLEQRKQNFQLGKLIDLTTYVAVNTDRIAYNTAVTAANTNVIAHNTAVTAANTSAIAANTSAIAANTSAIASNTSRMANDMAHMSANSDRIAANTGVAAAAAVGTYGEVRRANSTLNTIAANQERLNNRVDNIYYTRYNRLPRY